MIGLPRSRPQTFRPRLPVGAVRRLHIGIAAFQCYTTNARPSLIFAKRI
ncbi:hypothetical protein BZL30_3766 [Mycobacterium kansasii]|uniref:Uncharacterized protein n=1 Tax=Mycobacterium kansasii TaxID=1768 RepID=A0A1V3XAD4_MYCKA|nr:hypothetical protein BZL30_3766 [Mycobacterium kansasii]